jgi:hypothetical protein
MCKFGEGFGKSLRGTGFRRIPVGVPGRSRTHHEVDDAARDRAQCGAPDDVEGEVRAHVHAAEEHDRSERERRDQPPHRQMAATTTVIAAATAVCPDG